MLILESEHDDVQLIDQLVNGFDLTGFLPESNVFNKRMKPAAMSCDELRRVSEMTRGNMLEMIRPSGDEVLDTQLYEATLKEVSKGFIEGPVNSCDMPPGATLTRRFGIRQKKQDTPNRRLSGFLREQQCDPTRNCFGPHSGSHSIDGIMRSGLLKVEGCRLS